MMACPEALMAQERRVFEALEHVDRFDIDATGALVLIGADRPLMTARVDKP
jgi:heat shock protein HslJ